MGMSFASVMSEASLMVSSSEKNSLELGTYTLSRDGEKCESEIELCLVFLDEAFILSYNSQSLIETPSFHRFRMC